MNSHKQCKRCGHKMDFSFRDGSSCLCENAPDGAALVIGAAGIVIGHTVPMLPLRTYQSAEMTICVGDRVLETSEINYVPPEPCAPSLAKRGVYEQIEGRAKREDLTNDLEVDAHGHLTMKPARLSPLAAAMLPMMPVINAGPGPSSEPFEKDTVTITLCSGDLEVYDVNGSWIELGPHSRSRNPGTSQIRVRRSDLEHAAPEILKQAGRDFGTSPRSSASDSGAYARGVRAAREAIAAARYDHERDHAEWSVRDVVVPEDTGK